MKKVGCPHGYHKQEFLLAQPKLQNIGKYDQSPKGLYQHACLFHCSCRGALNAEGGQVVGDKGELLLLSFRDFVQWQRSRACNLSSGLSGVPRQEGEVLGLHTPEAPGEGSKLSCTMISKFTSGLGVTITTDASL